MVKEHSGIMADIRARRGQGRECVMRGRRGTAVKKGGEHGSEGKRKEGNRNEGRKERERESGGGAGNERKCGNETNLR